MAIRISASGEYVKFTSNLPGITNFTIMAWFYYISDRNTWASLIYYGKDPAPDSGAYYQIGTPVDGSTFQLYNGVATATSLTFVAATWYHAALTVTGTSGSNCKGYINGALEATIASTAVPLDQAIWLGNDVPDEWADCRIAAIKIYSAVLNIDEINRERRQYLPVRTNNLNRFLPGLNHTDLVDYSGNGYTTLSGGTLSTEDGPPIPWSFNEDSKAQTSTAILAASKRMRLGVGF